MKDSIVPYSQSVQLAEKLKELGVVYKIDLVPDADHIFDLTNVTPQMWKELILPVFEFIQAHMIGYLVENIEV